MAGNSKAIGVAYSDQNLDGSQLGATNGTLGFFGAPLTTQPAATNQAAPTTTAAAQISATQWGFSTSTQANAVITCVNAMQAALVSLGLIKGSN